MLQRLLRRSQPAPDGRYILQAARRGWGRGRRGRRSIRWVGRKEGLGGAKITVSALTRATDQPSAPARD
jgi:hypothetical protein